MHQISSHNLNEAISGLRETEPRILELGKKMLSADDGNLFPVDLLAIAAMKRTAGNTEGFITLVNAQNMSAARTLLRVQVDTFIRFHALWLVEKPHDLATDVIGGKHIRNIKDKNGKRMTDGYLIEVLSDDVPWLKDVYSRLSGYVHFSGQHLSNSVQDLDENDQRITIEISKEDLQYPERSWIEIVDCFANSVHILIYYLNGWIKTKNGS